MKKILILFSCAAMLWACAEKNNVLPAPDPDPENPGTEEPANTPEFFSDGFMKGTTLCFAQYEMDLGLKYREGDKEKDPYASLKDHGGNIVRLQLNFEDFPVYKGATIDWASWKRVLADAKKAKANGLDVLLTLKPDADVFHDGGTTDHNVVPAAWMPKNETQLGDALYEWVYGVLCDLAKEEIYPRAVAVGNEVTVGFLKASASDRADAARTGRLLMKGFRAVRDYAARYNPDVISLLHIDNPSLIEWFVAEIRRTGCSDFDAVATSWYPGTQIGHRMGNGKYATFAGICAELKAQGYGFMVLETAYTFTLGNDAAGKWAGDWCDNSYYYPDWDDKKNAENYTPARQRAWLGALAKELKDAGALGLVTWGTESLPDLLSGKADGHGLGLYTYPADWGYGSTWENNSYWDFTDGNNLHEGIDWMKDVL